MSLDGRAVRAGETIEADLCLIGAGAAGIAVARELRGSDLSICLLESGGLEADKASQDLYRGEIAGHDYFTLDSCRLRFFGGTTNHWAGNCRPLDPIDFAERAWVPHSGWPIDRETLDPYYERAQPVCELGPYDYDPNAWFGAGREAPLPFDAGRLITVINQYSPPTRFGARYRTDVTGADNVRTLLHSNVIGMESDESGKRVSSVRVATLSGNRFSVRARAVVLACGGIENARILLASQATAARRLGLRDEFVGRFFMDHVVRPGAGLFVPTHSDFAPRPYMQRVRREQTWLRAVLSPPPKRARSEQILHSRIRLDPQPWAADADGLARHLQGIASPGRPARGLAFGINVRSEHAPNPESRVALSDDTDALGLPRVRLDWRLSELDHRTLQRSAEIVASEIGRLALGRVRLSRPTPESDGIRGAWHHMGTTRMSSTPATGVVDADCRVHGVSNLYVAGSSVFPTSGQANPTLTIVALALRLADHLAKVLQ